MKLTTSTGNEYEGTPEHVFAAVKAAEPQAIPRIRQGVILDYVHNIARAYKALDRENIKRLLTEAIEVGLLSEELFAPLKKIYGIIVKNKHDKMGTEYISIRKGVTGKEVMCYTEQDAQRTILQGRKDEAKLELNNQRRELATVEQQLGDRLYKLPLRENEGTLADRVMKIDEYVDQNRTGEGDEVRGILGKQGEGHLNKGPIGGIVQHSPRYLLDTRVGKLVDEIADDAPMAAFEHTKTPCGCFWMEYKFENVAHPTCVGTLWVGNEDQDNPHPELETLPSVEAAVKSMVSDSSLTEGNLFVFIQSAGMITTYVLPVVIGQPVVLPELEERETQNLTALYRFFLAFCMLMTSPKTHVVEEVEFTRLNKKRTEKGKSTFSSFSRVKLSVDGPVTRSRGGASSGGTSGSGDGHEEGAHHGGKRLHMVNHFWRTKRGKLEFVRPHWRGNPELGTISRKRVTA